MTDEMLVAALMREDRFEREIGRIEVAVEGLRVNDQLIRFRLQRPAILGPARPAALVSILHRAHKAKASRDSLHASLPSPQLGV
jgi:hypothetical protein